MTATITTTQPAASAGTFRGTLLPHQEAGLAFLRSQPRAILADEVGLGKTVQAAALIGSLHDSGELPAPKPDRLPVLWVTKAGLVTQTLAELKRFLPDLWIFTLGNGKASAKVSEADKAMMRQHGAPHVVVTTHTMLQTQLRTYEAMRPQLVVVDEASALKGQGVQHQALKWACDDAPRVVAMTATPYENNPDELFGLFSLVGLPGLPTREAYLRDYCEVRTFPDGTSKVEGWAFPAGIKAKAVRDAVRPYLLRRTVAEVGLALPTRADEPPRLVPLTARQLGAYQWAQSGMADPLRRLAYQRKVSRHGKDGVGTLVPAALAEVVALTGAGHKVVVYAEHLEDCDELSEGLTAAGIGHLSLRGENDKEERQEAVDTFRDDEDILVLVGTKVLEFGLNLQFANILVSVGVSFNPGRERQREGRICRIGSPHSTYRHISFLPDTPLTRRQIETLDRKERDAQAFLNA